MTKMYVILTSGLSKVGFFYLDDLLDHSPCHFQGSKKKKQKERKEKVPNNSKKEGSFKRNAYIMHCERVRKKAHVPRLVEHVWHMGGSQEDREARKKEDKTCVCFMG